MTPAYVEIAHDIGTGLGETAIWHEDRCNWMGVRPVGNGRVGIREAVATLGADLYGGTSGVALYLAELHAITGDEVVRRTALGAVRHALARVDTTESIGWGLYDGRLGIALAAARIGALLCEERLLERATAVATNRLHPWNSGYDLISGRAGSIVALLVLCRLLDDRSLLEHAVELGDELLEAATRDGGSYTWPRVDDPSMRPLTGLAHGAAGIGYALGEPCNHTGEARYAEAAAFAFAYEREHFQPDVGNWPDFRHERRRRRLSSPAFATQWCHGAPGIAMSRLRAYQLRNEETCLVEAAAGIAATRDAVANSLARPGADFSLCHGLAGNAEVLLDAAHFLGPGWTQDRDLALEVAESGIDRIATTHRPWPFGTRQGTTPNLMVGLAGIGHFYLRLHDQTIPSLLLLRPECFPSTKLSSH